MIYHDQLSAVLGPLVGGRYHPIEFKQPDKPTRPTWPAIRGVQVGVENFPDICGSGEEADDSPRVQLDVVSNLAGGYTAHAELCSAVRAAMLGFPVPALLELAIETTDQPTGTYRTILDYSLQG